MPSFSKGLVQQVVTAIQPVAQIEVPEGSRIQVHAAVSRFSVLYERIRNAVDYKDDHLLRKSAIRRILQRQLILESDADVIAHNLVRELIAARYLPNGVLPEQLIGDVAVCVKKYLAIEKAKAGSRAHYEWLRGVITIEIEELLVDQTQNKAFTTFLYERVVDRVHVRGGGLSDADVRLQVYVACHRSFLKADDEIVSYKLLRAYIPEWMRPQAWLEDADSVAERLIQAEAQIIATMQHPLAQKFQKTIKPWSVALRILWDALLEKPGEMDVLFEKPDKLHLALARQADRRNREAKSRLRRGAVRATIYLLITKMLVAFAIEVPVEYAWYKEVALTALIINVSFPPLLMFAVGLLIRVVGKENTKRVQANVDALLSAEGVPMQEIRIRQSGTGVGATLLRLAYTILFVCIFGLIGWFLMLLHFTPVSASIFIFFLCVVSFFAFRLRQNAREFVIVDSKDTFWSLIIDFISLPILRAGHFLAQSFSRINVFLFFFDFLFEAPFKIFLSVLEDWLSFLKEKKEELQ